jgi:hypothetical protein
MALLSVLAMIFIGHQRDQLPPDDRWFSYYWFHSSVTVLIFSLLSLLHLSLSSYDIYKISPNSLRTSGGLTSLLFLMGDAERRLLKSSEDSEYYVVVFAAILLGLFVGVLLYSLWSSVSIECLPLLPFLSAAISSSAFYIGREAFEDAGPYDYKGSMIPLAVTMGVFLIVCTNVCYDVRRDQYSSLPINTDN